MKLTSDPIYWTYNEIRLLTWLGHLQPQKMHCTQPKYDWNVPDLKCFYLELTTSPGPTLFNNITEKVILTTSEKQEWPPTWLKRIQEKIIFTTQKQYKGHPNPNKSPFSLQNVYLLQSSVTSQPSFNSRFHHMQLCNTRTITQIPVII